MFEVVQVPYWMVFGLAVLAAVAFLDRLLSDPKVMQAVADHALAEDMPGDIAAAKARRCERLVSERHSVGILVAIGACD